MRYNKIDYSRDRVGLVFGRHLPFSWSTIRLSAKGESKWSWTNRDRDKAFYCARRSSGATGGSFRDDRHDDYGALKKWILEGAVNN